MTKHYLRGCAVSPPSIFSIVLAALLTLAIASPPASAAGWFGVEDHTHTDPPPHAGCDPDGAITIDLFTRTCGSVQAACTSIENWRQSHWNPTAVLTGIEFASAGPGGVNYKCLLQEGILSRYEPTSKLCVAGDEGDPNSTAGCSPFVDKRTLGQICKIPGAIPRANPINVGTGNKYQRAVDVRVPGSAGLQFVRHYNSRGWAATMLARAWTGTFDRRLSFNRSSSYIYWADAQRADGRVLHFVQSGGNFVPDSDVGETLVHLGATWELRGRDNTVETYDDTDGRLLSARRQGYQIDLQYDANGVLLTATDSFGRQLSFTYDAQGRMDSITDPDGQITRYVYDDTPHTLGNASRLSQVVYPDDTPADPNDNPHVTYHYEDARYPFGLTGITDENGVRVATWAYDDRNRATLSEHAGGADRTTIAYDDTDGSRTVTNALGKQTVYQFTTLQNVPKSTQIDGLASANCSAASAITSYDVNGFVASTTDNNGNVTNYVNDSRGQRLSRTDAVGTPEQRTTTTTWHATLFAPTQIAAPGRTTDFAYDAEGRLTSRTVTDTTTHTTPYETAGQTRSWTYGYTPQGQLTSVDGPRIGVADVTNFAYDASGNLTGVTNALGHVTQITAHDASGRPLTTIDANGIATQLSYDARGRLETRTVNPGAGQSVTGYAYDDRGDVTGITLPEGATLTYVYDSARRLTEVQNALGEKIVYTLDAMGNRTKVDVLSATGQIVRTQSHAFDELGRLLRDTGAALQETSYAYDLNGNTVTLTDPVGAVTSNAYDGLNRLVSTTDAQLQATAYAYDARDGLVAVTDARGSVTGYVRNGFGEVIQETSPDRGAVVHVRDEAGNVTRRTDGRGAVTDHTYDALNRALTATRPASPAEDVAYSYDDATPGRHGIGRLTAVSDHTGSRALDYDARGNLTVDERTIGGVVYQTAYEWDAADRLTRMVYPSGRIVDYQRDALGRIATVTTQADEFSPVVTLAANIAWQPFGPLAGFDAGNGQATDLSYDQDFRLTGRTTSDGVTDVANITYAHDAAANVTAITDILYPSLDQSFTYDTLHRLTQATGAYGAIGYGHDAAGNRTSRIIGAAAESYTIDPYSNRLSSVDDGAVTRALSWDAAGNLIADDRGAAADLTFGYDQAGRLAAVAEAGVPIVNAQYNAGGERAVMVAGGTIAHALYDSAGGLIAEYGAGLGTATAPAAETVVDDGAAGTASAGAWTSSTAGSGYEGSGYVVSSDGTAASYSWTPALSGAGPQLVSVRWPAGLSEGGLVTFRVTHDGGATDIEHDQRVGGGAWVALGIFEMTPGLGHGVTLYGPAPVSAPPVEVTVDNGDAGISTYLTNTFWSWISSACCGAYLDNWQRAYNGTSTSTPYTWPLTITDSGTYDVYARWVSSSINSISAPYIIYHDGGPTTVQVDQRTGGGQWNLLGSFAFSAGDTKVELQANAVGGYLIADAVQLVKDGLVQPIAAADAVRIERFTPPSYPTASSTLTREYVTLGGGGAALPLAVIAAGAVSYVHADHLGTPQKMTDASGALVWDRQQRPFGETAGFAAIFSFPPKVNNQRFPGQYADAATGLHYNYFRHYDPTLGRYVTSDPIGLAGGLNTYAYVEGNPVNAIDPDGQLAWWVLPLAMGGLDLGLQLYRNGGRFECVEWGEVFFAAALGLAPGGGWWALGRAGAARAAVGGAIGRGLTGAVGRGITARSVGSAATGNAPGFAKNSLPHIFRNASGHVNPSTTASVKRFQNMFQKVASNPANRNNSNMSPNAISNGTQQFMHNFRNGQVWVHVRN